MISWLIEKLIQKNDIERYSKQNFNNEYSNLLEYGFSFLSNIVLSIAQERSRSRPNLRAPLKFHEERESGQERKIKKNKGR